MSLSPHRIFFSFILLFVLTGSLGAQTLPAGYPLVTESDGTMYLKIEPSFTPSPFFPYDYQERLNRWLSTHILRTPSQSLSQPPVRLRKLVATVNLFQQLDKHLRIEKLFWLFNKSMYYASLTIDRGQSLFFAFTPPTGETLLEPDKRIGRESISVQLDPSTRYRLTLYVNIFDPMGSKVWFAPDKGYSGPSHSVSARQLIGFLRSKAIPIPMKDDTYYLLYGSDADPKSKRLASSKSIYFLQDKGLDSKFYTIGEEKVVVGQWTQIEVGPNTVLLSRPTVDVLEVYIQ
ncbi:MAG: hypothetical protein HY399_04175 [Elusimicrobia bacterium]|nr:hypothetical protein [Elusimicrobiota bacterium]